MKQKFIYLFFIAALFSLSSGASAQSVAKTLKLATKAAGGEKALRAAMQSFQKTGEITRLSDGARGRISIQGAVPNFYNVSYDLGGVELETGFNGKSAWTRDSRGGLQTLTGVASRDFQAEAMFRNNLWLNHKKEKAKIASCQSANIAGGNTADCLLYTTAKGVSMKLFFDRTSSLLVREEIPAGDSMKIYEYDDYRKLNGLSEPFSIKQTIGEEVYEIKLERIAHKAPVAATDFDFPKVSGAPLPDIPELLKSVQANEDRIEKMIEDYHYKQKVVNREFDKNGALRETSSQTAQISFFQGNRLRRLIEKNGKPLSPDEQAAEDEKVQKRVEEIGRQIAKKEAKAAATGQTQDDEDQRTSIAEMLRASNLINPRRERFRGRDVIVFDFEPNPNFDYKNAKSILKVFGKMTGAMWIDEKDKQVARLEATLADGHKIGGGFVARVKKGASLMLEKERVNEEIWLPSVTELNLSAKVMLVKGISVNQIARAYEYRKFATEVKDAKIEEIK
jgi:hypothetical protein